MIQDLIYRLSEGNPGAITALVELYNTGDFDEIVGKLDSMHLYGPYIYVLWNDRAEKDIEMFIVYVRELYDSNFTTEFIKEKLGERHHKKGIDYFYM